MSQGDRDCGSSSNDVKVWLFDPMDYTVHGILQNTGVGSLSLLQGVIPTQGWNPGLRTAGGFFTSWAPREVKEYWSG